METKTMKKRGRGRPRIMKNTKRIIIQVDASELKTIQMLIKNQISVSQFFRNAADHAIANPHIILGHSNGRTNQ